MEYIIKLAVNSAELLKKETISSEDVKKILANLLVDKKYKVNIADNGCFAKIFWSSWAIDEAFSQGLDNGSRAFVFIAGTAAENKVNQSLLKYQQLYKLIYVPFEPYAYLVTEQTLQEVPVANLAYALGFIKPKEEKFALNKQAVYAYKTLRSADITYGLFVYAYRHFRVTKSGVLKAVKDSACYYEEEEQVTKDFAPMYFAEHKLEDLFK